MQASPPSTYILKDLHDVGLPEHVSWMPQTIGWKIIAVVALLALIVFIYRTLQGWWHNRYRREAIAVLTQLPIDDPQYEYQVFIIMKRVMAYVDSQCDALYGQAFLNQLDKMLGDQPFTLEDSLSSKWLLSLNSQSHALQEDEKSELQTYCLHWIQQHQCVKGGEECRP